MRRMSLRQFCAETGEPYEKMLAEHEAGMAQIRRGECVTLDELMARLSEPTPTRVTPITEPTTEPMRRMEPERICPNQRSRVGTTIRRLLP